MSEKEFAADCGEGSESAEPKSPPEPRWKVVTKWVLLTAFALVWLEAVTAFSLNISTFRDGSPVPTVEKSEPMTEKGHTVYVRPADKKLADQAMALAFIGIPATILTAFFLQFVVGVKLTWT